MPTLELLGNTLKRDMYVEVTVKGFSQVTLGTSDQGESLDQCCLIQI